MPSVERIWTAPEGGAPMAASERVRAVEGGGLRGDRYCHGRGYYSPYDVCQVTLVDSGALETVRERYDIDLSDGRHRRNLVVDYDVVDLLDTRFSVGEAVFEGTRRRPPCARVEEVAGEDDLAEALGEERGGICADVVEGGEITVGDELEVVERLDDPDSLADAIRERRE
ncbi:MOSC domain-containing protein [Halosimplex litoreum]|uniref:MOSC domain-containing protein n=1 Tax=Halosimplex litoreum TaxID=1198301 RepID=A0A7T3KVX2_9EURY|nr:MOSC domain-containing protein [Halosimplex litoreum]QPV63448.1 MOSC domain-containing protein [Halosimplex litoreum]